MLHSKFLMRFCWVSIQTLKANIQDIASIYQSTCVINSDVSFHVLAVSLWQRQMEAGPQSFGLKQLLFVTGDRSTHSRACSQNIFMGARQIFNILVCYKKSIWKTETCSCSTKCSDQKRPSIQSFITMTVHDSLVFMCKYKHTPVAAVQTLMWIRGFASCSWVSSDLWTVWWRCWKGAAWSVCCF